MMLKETPEKKAPTSAETTTRDRPAGTSRTNAVKGHVKATRGYEAQAALLKPPAPPETPKTTAWSTTIRANFKRLDSNSDGFISRSEANAAMSDQSYAGADAAAVAALHKYLDLLEELSNDEFGDENDGLTLSDLAAYEKGTLKAKLKGDLTSIEATHLRGQSAIAGAKRELFPNGVPDLSALRQGAIGDCYFLAALGSFIARDPAALTRMITENRKNRKVVSYTVKFHGKLGTVTVPPPADGEIARYSSAGADGLWLVVMEKAYARARSGDKRPDVQEEIGEGGHLSTGISAFTSAGTDKDLLAVTRQSTTSRKLDSAFVRGKKAGTGKKRLVTAAIQSSNRYALPKGHAYSVIGWDGKDLVIRNPWGYLPAPGKDDTRLRGQPGKDPYATGIFLLSLGEFDDVFFGITYEE